jgi:TonB-dependent starch-binding outer membrane protein SusC
MKKLIIFLIGISLTLSLSAQHRVVYGRVNVFKNLQLCNIVVTAKKTGTKTLTDSLGNFAIVCNERDVIKFSGATFNTERVRVKPGIDSINVEMHFIESGKEDNVGVAIGYGYIPKSQAAFAYSEIKRDKHIFCSYSDIYALINGRCPGVVVKGGESTGPGEEQEIIIRGVKSINASNCALYVVDGIVVPSIADIAPCNVKNITFLKDGEAAIYGSRGAVGVVLIETYKGVD